MKDLVGRSFAIAECRYRIVDVRQLGGDALVYAETLDPGRSADPVRAGARSVARTAFRYGDIAGALEAQAGA